MSFAIIRAEKLKSKAQIVSRLKHDLRLNQVLNSNPQFGTKKEIKINF